MADNAVSTKNIWPNYSKTNVNLAKSGGSTLGKDQFIKILITQMQNQDPMQPMQDREFIAQMAQFSSLEQMLNMTTEVKQLRESLSIASGMIGKQVTWIEANKQDPENPAVHEGIVDSIIVRDGEQYVISGSSEVKVSDIVGIANAAPTTGETETGS